MFVGDDSWYGLLLNETIGVGPSYTQTPVAGRDQWRAIIKSWVISFQCPLSGLLVSEVLVIRDCIGVYTWAVYVRDTCSSWNIRSERNPWCVWSPFINYFRRVIVTKTPYGRYTGTIPVLVSPTLRSVCVDWVVHVEIREVDWELEHHPVVSIYQEGKRTIIIDVRCL